MVLDEPKETDETFSVNGFTVVVDKGLLDMTKEIKVDFVDYAMGSGFRLTPAVPIGGGSCGSGCSSCS